MLTNSKRSILILLLMAISATLSAQQAETVSFSDIENEYKSGRVDNALQMLKHWLGEEKKINAETKNRKAELYRLAAHCYVLAEKPDSAQFYIRKMLLIWPDYKETSARKIDLERFRMAIDTLYTLPKLQLGLHGGINYTLVDEKRYYSVMQYDANIKPTISRGSQLSFQVGLSLDYDFSKYFALSVEPGVNSLVHTYQRGYNGGSSGLDEINFTESLTYADINLIAYLRLFPRSKTRISMGIGPTLALLVRSTKEIEGTNSSLSSSSSMSNYVTGFLGRIAFTRRFHHYSLGADLSYVLYADRANEPSSRFINDPQDAVSSYGFYSVPDDIVLSGIQANLSFKYFINYKVYH